MPRLGLGRNLVRVALAGVLCGAHAAGQVRLGVDVLLEEQIELVEGKRVGLVTHPAGVDGALVPTLDRLHRDERVNLVQLYGPEHGVRGEVAAGVAVEDARDARTGIPVESLYGGRRRPSAESLARIDVLLFELQDVGARMYTYISTLGEVMRAAGEAGVRVVVLDRPNPIGGVRFEGPVVIEEWQSFISWGPLPMSHGMTIGEIAGFWRREMGVECELEVVRMRGWKRAMVWEETGLEWIQSSPHIPHAVNAHLYLATGAIGESFEGIHCGVGYTTPFEVLAARGLDEHALSDSMNARDLAGVRFLPFVGRPFYGEQEGVEVRGVRLVLTDPAVFRPVRTALGLMCEVQIQLGDELVVKSDRAFAIRWGNLDVLNRIRAGDEVAELEALWQDRAEEFAEARSRSLLY